MVTYTAGPNVGVRHPVSRFAALRANPHVALTVDTDGYPPRSLTSRGEVQISEIEGSATEYPAATRRYLGEPAAAAMLAAVDQPSIAQARITVAPTRVGLLDFVSRLPSVQGGWL
jgi:hypothetical protein